MAASRVIIGVGNLLRGDDAAGREVARRLSRAGLEGWDVVELDGESTAVLSRLEGAEAAILIDACMSNAPGGTVRRFDVSQAPLVARPGGLSHSLGLFETLELARALGVLPPRCIVYTIEVEQVNFSAALTACVATAIEDAAARVRLEAEDARSVGQ